MSKHILLLFCHQRCFVGDLFRISLLITVKRKCQMCGKSHKLKVSVQLESRFLLGEEGMSEKCCGLDCLSIRHSGVPLKLKTRY